MCIFLRYKFLNSFSQACAQESLHSVNLRVTVYPFSSFIIYICQLGRLRRKQMTNQSFPWPCAQNSCFLRRPFSDTSCISTCNLHFLSKFCQDNVVDTRPVAQLVLSSASTFPACTGVATPTPAPFRWTRCVRLRLIRNECTKVMSRINGNGTACCH